MSEPSSEQEPAIDTRTMTTYQLLAKWPWRCKSY